MVNSRSKGARGERELARELTWVLGVDARRGQQFAGGPESPDIVLEDLKGVHIECKRVESLSLYKAMEQSIRDAGSNNIPTVMHKRNHKDWLVIVRLEDLPALARRIVEFMEEQDNE